MAIDTNLTEKKSSPLSELPGLKSVMGIANRLSDGLVNAGVSVVFHGDGSLGGKCSFIRRGCGIHRGNQAESITICIGGLYGKLESFAFSYRGDERRIGIDKIILFGKEVRLGYDRAVIGTSPA